MARCEVVRPKHGVGTLHLAFTVIGSAGHYRRWWTQCGRFVGGDRWKTDPDYRKPESDWQRRPESRCRVCSKSDGVV